ncbi:MAG TPA: hypothetical protein VG496_11765 [Myxococcales bacterium]|nr:hypothetical protein [Myxococcales bacterium]
MSASRLLRRLLPVIAGAVFAHCDPAAPPGYLGDPLLTVRGQVASSGPIDIQLEAAMLWQRGPPPGTNDEELATHAPVQTGFPSTFTMSLYQPPPVAALRTLLPGQVTYARANAAAVPPSVIVAMSVPGGGGSGGASAVPGPTGPQPGQSPNYGFDANHWVMYLASDVPRGSLTEWWLGDALPAGFHLLRVTWLTCISDADLQACVSELVQRGVTDDGTTQPGTARFFCTQPYRLSVAPANEELVLTLAAPAPAASGTPCPP